MSARRSLSPGLEHVHDSTLVLESPHLIVGVLTRRAPRPVSYEMFQAWLDVAREDAEANGEAVRDPSIRQSSSQHPSTITQHPASSIQHLSSIHPSESRPGAKRLRKALTVIDSH